MMRFAVLFIFLILLGTAVSIAATQYYPSFNESGAFFNGSETTYVYTGNYSCYPPVSSVIPNLTTNQSAYGCYLGIKSQQSQALPDWILVPAYAGMSVFGSNSSDGMPVFRNSTVYTDCGAGDYQTRCRSDPSYAYSPQFISIENIIGSKSFDGKPYGIMPLPAHSHLVNDTFSGDPIPWYVIVVYVFDPNIMPNATNGKCTEIVNSNVTNPEGNCLTSLSAIKRAMETYDNATINANSGNPLWIAFGNPLTEVYIPNDTNASDVGDPNTNIVVPFAVKSYDFYSLKPNSTTKTTTVLQTKQPTSNQGIELGIVVVIIIIIVIAALVLSRKSKKN